jgi:hypothetical protein
VAESAAERHRSAEVEPLAGEVAPGGEAMALMDAGEPGDAVVP